MGPPALGGVGECVPERVVHRWPLTMGGDGDEWERLDGWIGESSPWSLGALVVRMSTSAPPADHGPELVAWAQGKAMRRRGGR